MHQVRQAKPREKSYTLADSGSLALFVTPRGTRHWHFRFTWKGKQTAFPLAAIRWSACIRRDFTR